MKTIEIIDLQVPEFEELDDLESSGVIGGVGIIESELKNLKSLSKELEAATEPTVVARLEARLING